MSCVVVVFSTEGESEEGYFDTLEIDLVKR